MDKYEKIISYWKEKNITTDAELAEVLNGHSIAFAYHSGNMENDRITYNDNREIFDHDGVTSYTGDLRTLFEIRNARNANELFLTAFGERRAFDEAFIKELQQELTMNYLLVLHGHPPVIVHQEDRKNYYAALEVWDRNQDLGTASNT